ncbi:MAG: Hsp20/alpha crystallin family protein [bacterium]|nr:Hsp20/alpha crystallin family protein [bacterium]
MNNVLVRPDSRFGGEIDRMVSDIFGFPHLRSEGEAEFHPRVNIKESRDGIALLFELPGLDKKDIKVTVKDGDLIVSGQREFRAESEEANYIRSEIRTGRFSRSFTLPETLDQNSIKAEYKNGILEVKFNKREEVKPREVEVTIG